MNLVKSMAKKLREKPLFRDTIITTACSTAGKGLGMLIPFFLAAWFGVTSETDAFFFAYSLILFLSSIFAPVVESIIVPFIAETRANNEDVGKFLGNIFGISGIGLILICIIFLLIIKPILSVVTSFSADNLNLIYILLLESAPLFILLIWTSLLSGTLNAYKKFAYPALFPGLRALVNLAFIFTFKNQLGVHAIAIGYVVGEMVRLISLLLVTKKLNLFTLKFSFSLTPKLKNFIKLGSYQTAGLVVQGLTPIINTTMASWISAGSVSILYYAERLFMIPTNLITTGLMVTVLSHWSTRHYESTESTLKNDVAKTAKIVLISLIPFTFLLMLFHEPITQLAYSRGKMAPDELRDISEVWLYYLIGILPYALALLYTQAHMVLKNTKIIMLSGICRVILTVIANLILIQFLQVRGIALSLSLVSIFFLGFMFITFNNRSSNRNNSPNI